MIAEGGLGWLKGSDLVEDGAVWYGLCTTFWEAPICLYRLKLDQLGKPFMNLVAFPADLS